MSAVPPAGLAAAPAAELSLCSSMELLSSAPNRKCLSDAQPSMQLSGSVVCAGAEEQGWGRGGLGV